MSPLTNMQVRDIETLIHPYTQLAQHRETGPHIIERAEGVYIWDQEGRQYIEAMSGLWCCSLGFGNLEIAETAKKQISQLSFGHIFSGRSHEGAIELSEKIKEISPAPASKVFFTCSGSEANDSQIKLLWYYNNARGRPEKKKIVARLKGYHGVTVAAASLTGLPANHMDFDLPLPGIVHTDCPHHYRNAEPGESEIEYSKRLADNLEVLIQEQGPETIAGFIAEPIMGAGGVIVPPESYFNEITKVLKRYDIYMISDEVICGFGRTGEMFGSQALGFTPDSISIAKAITSAYAPLGAITVGEDMYSALLDQSEKIGTFGHGFTYSGHPLSTAIALKTLEIYKRDKILEHVQQVTPLFLQRLSELNEFEFVGETRGMGLIGALEFVEDKRTKKSFESSSGIGAQAAKFCREEGIIARPLGEGLALCPPLIISTTQIEELFSALKRAVQKTHDWVIENNLRTVD